jgi:hypothetical protein
MVLVDYIGIFFKTLNILHKKFQIGIKLQYQVVVGDGKSYDHLIKLKSEYGGSLSWVLPYPGDWHMLFFIFQCQFQKMKEKS